MKKVLPVLLVLLIAGCAYKKEEIKVLPKKELPLSSLMSDSPLSATNIEHYLFFEDVLYVDTRNASQYEETGHIAGFVNIPFYECIASLEVKDNILFKISKIRDENGKVIANMGDVGSYTPNYKESVDLLNDLFPKDKPIVFMATAGVESAYLINLLIQYGWDASLLYNAGAIENSLAPNIAYFDLEDSQYLVSGIDTYHKTIAYDWGDLTPIE